MQGTFINVASIIIGSLIGRFLGIFVKERYGNCLIQTMGLVALSLGISWIAKNLPQSELPLLFIGALAVGNIIGISLKLQDRVDNLQHHFSHTDSKNEHNLMQGIITTTLLFCLGTFSILGPIKAALNQDYTLLYINAMLDGITCIIFAATYGFGIAFSAVILFIWQGSLYLLAGVLEPYVSDQLFVEMNIIGGILILSTGLNILQLTKIKVLNMLPAIFLTMIYIILFH